MKVYKTVLISTFLSLVFLLAFLTALFLFSAKNPADNSAIQNFSLPPALSPLKSLEATRNISNGLQNNSVIVNDAQTDLPAQTGNKLCMSKTEERIVRGSSLTGLIEPGQTVKILLGFYDCNDVKRGDVITYNYAGDKNPLIKIVKGISGDRFHLQKTEGGWHILVNDEIVRNSQNQPYVFDEGGYKMLSLYERDYAGVIPENAYLILGNLASGSLDSSHFGLIDKKDILGKVEF